MPAEVAHHRTPLDAGGAKFEGLEALCRLCHESEHNRGPNEEQRAWGKYIAELRRTIEGDKQYDEITDCI